MIITIIFQNYCVELEYFFGGRVKSLFLIFSSKKGKMDIRAFAVQLHVAENFAYLKTFLFQKYVYINPYIPWRTFFIGTEWQD